MGKLVLKRIEYDYSKIGLSKNPFPYGGIPEHEPRFCADRINELDIIGEVIGHSLNNNSTHLSIIANYGNGKTHLLRYVKTQINQQLSGKNDYRALGCYIITPGTSFLDLYRNFIRELGQQFFTDFAWNYIGQCYMETTSTNDDMYKIIEECKDDPKRIKKYVDDGSILLPDVLNKTRKQMLSYIKNTDVITAFLQLAYDNPIMPWKWFSGELMLHEHRRKIGIVSSIEREDAALQIFQDILALLHRGGYNLICLLIDEFESITGLHYQQKQRYLNTIRHLIDLNPQGLCLLIACTPEIWKQLVMEYHAFSGRIFREIILKPLKTDSLYDLILEYLTLSNLYSENRVNPLHPFTKEGLDEILMKSQGNIRRTLNLCNVSIDRLMKTGKAVASAEFIQDL